MKTINFMLQYMLLCKMGRFELNILDKVERL